ncbi:DNRLRE domain-containing protein [Paenibacillus lactis]|uniref:DNRLRE domain-containing protein n=1 Tax=Paenibacillus lactis TaxID=228574 RepID=UPI003D747913
MFRIVEQTRAQMQQGYFSSSDIYVDGYGKLTLVNRNAQTNLALGRPYKRSDNSPIYTGDSDTNNQKFTDGNRSSYFRYSNMTDEEIVIDLGAVRPVGGAFFTTGLTTGANTPEYVEILGSIDGINFKSYGKDGQDNNRQHTFNIPFSQQARYIKFKATRATAYLVAFGEGEVYDGTVRTAYREHIYDISSVGKLRNNNAYWIEELPTGTSIQVETAISLDSGSTWSGWEFLDNGGTLQNIPLGTDLRNARLKVRITLKTNNIYVPSLLNFNFYFDDTPKSDENNIIIPRNAYSLNPINPGMTSANSPAPYEVTGSGVNITAYPPWKAFDGSITNISSNCWAATINSYVILDVGENNKTAISRFRIHRYRSNYLLTSFKIEASNDNLNWTIIDIREGLNWALDEYNKEFFFDSSKIDTKNTYRFFKFTILNATSTISIFIDELQFFELIDGNGYQITSTFTIPYGSNLASKLFIPIHNRATGTVRILPLIKYELPSKVDIKIHGNLLSRVNVPISNRASAIVSVVKRPTTTLSLPPEKDAFVRESIPKLNYGSEQDMYAGFNTNYHEVYRSFVGFDVSAIPNNAEIKNAYFKFYNELNNSPIQKVEIYELASDWTEKGITWDNQPRPTDKITQLDVGAAGGYLYVDFTDIVREWYEGNKVNRGFMIRALDETELYYKRFYTRESMLPPSLEIEYYDKTVYTFEKVDLTSRVLIRQHFDKDLLSRLNVRQVWFDHAIPSRIKVANMGTMDSHVIVKDPYLLSRITVKQTNNEDLTSKITVRVKLERTFNSEVTVNKPFQLGRIRVRRRDTREILSKVRVRVGGRTDFSSSVNISKGFVYSRVSVVRSEYLPSRVTVAGLGNRTLPAKIIVRRSDQKDVKSHIRIFQKELLPSRVHVVSGYLKSRVHIPFRAVMDQPSKVLIRVRSAKDMVSRIRIEDPYGDSWGYVYIL